MASVPGSMFGRLVGMTRGDGLRAQLLRGGVGSVAVKIVATGLSFAVAVVLARLLGPEGYGIYAYAFALVSILAIPAQFGLPNLVIRETAKAQAREDWGLMRGLSQKRTFAPDEAVPLRSIGCVLREFRFASGRFVINTCVRVLAFTRTALATSFGTRESCVAALQQRTRLRAITDLISPPIACLRRKPSQSNKIQRT